MVNARGAALRALVQLERGRQSRLRAALAGAPLDPREMALAWELAHGVLRHRRLLDWALVVCTNRGLPKDPRLLTALRLGAHQLLFCAHIPAHAAVNETVALVRENRAFGNAVLRRLSGMVAARPADPGLPRTEVPLGPARALVLPAPGLPEDPVAALAVRHSLPDFLVQRWRERLTADELAAACAASSAVPEVFLRQVGDGTAEALRQQLLLEGVQCEPTDHPRVLRWTDGMSPFASPAFAAGRLVAQDPTALRAAEAVPVEPGMTVVDLCAAPGTKTTLLAERVQPGGRVWAHDRDPARAERIAENVARLRLGPWVRIVGSATDLPLADCVLADVPCSNTGVLGRRIEARLRLQPGTFAELAQVQAQLLAQAAALCKPGGTVVYSTCSIEPEENGELVRAAMPAGFTLVDERRTLPAAGRHDGGYVAVLRHGPLPAGPAAG